jgi:hypothetical protein
MGRAYEYTRDADRRAACSIGELNLTFEAFPEKEPPYAWLNVHSDSEDSRLGGVAINCLNMGDASTFDSLLGKTFMFNEDDEQSGSELRESVFWRPNDDTLELESLEIRIDPVSAQAVLLNIQSKCFDHDGNAGIVVEIHGTATFGG